MNPNRAAARSNTVTLKKRNGSILLVIWFIFLACKKRLGYQIRRSAFEGRKIGGKAEKSEDSRNEGENPKGVVPAESCLSKGGLLAIMNELETCNRRKGSNLYCTLVSFLRIKKLKNQ
jgi:hypothetical protein